MVLEAGSRGSNRQPHVPLQGAEQPLVQASMSHVAEPCTYGAAVEPTCIKASCHDSACDALLAAKHLGVYNRHQRVFAYGERRDCQLSGARPPVHLTTGFSSRVCRLLPQSAVTIDA